MIMTFVKKLFSYLIMLTAVVGGSVAIILLADRYLGTGMWGVVILTSAMVLYFIVERSWQEAKRKHDKV